jgi:Kelch motif
MKKQGNSTIKAHLLRSAFYMLLLLGVCAIPFALAQRSTKKSTRAIPVTYPAHLFTSGPASAHRLPILPMPQAPLAILYDQYDNFGTNATSSQDFEAALDPFDDELADDFVVPGGQTWSVESIDADGVYFNGAGPAQNFNVRFYNNSGGLPGALVASRIGMSYTHVGTTFSVTLSPAVSLSAGTYWVSVQARQDLTPAGQWGWTDRTLQSNSPAAWQNPGGGFGVCQTWGQRGATCQIDPGVPDQVYRLIGTTGGGTPTPTPTPGCSWSAGASLPSVGIRIVGVFFPANGKFYGMGGRSSDSAGSDFMHPFEYDPGTNTWTTKSATYPDNQVNNMACGVLNDAGTDYIYCVGGSAAGATTATDRVFRYNPVTDTISAVNAPWPGDANGTTLPGGFSVFNNKLYTIGGFVINIQMIADIWEFTPGANSWVQKVSLPVERGYVPATTIGNLIYTAGGSLWDGITLQDTNDSFVFDPVANTVSPIANIPRATAETRALNFCNSMYVMGGGRTAPNPSNEVDIYDPGSNTWSTGIPFVTARRNFPTDTDGTSAIWLAGGYAPTTPTDSMEIFSCDVSPCGTPTPTPTPTATPTPTPGEIVLTFAARRGAGRETVLVRLMWTGARSPRVDIYRNGEPLARVDNTGTYTDVLTEHAFFTYKVCEGHSRNCSNEVTVRGP